MLLECCGAVFVATPDDPSSIRGHQVRAPRGNVMLEFGLVAGRMGRRNIALCQSLWRRIFPSDLQGLTTIAMDPPSDCKDVAAFQKQAEQKLTLWGSRLIATADQIARTEIVHGYTGRWDFSINLNIWRDLSGSGNRLRAGQGLSDLIVPAGGRTGHGLAHGALYFRLPGTDGRVRPIKANT